MAPRKRRGRLSAVVTSRKVVEETVQVVVTAADGETESQSQPNVDAFASQVSDGTEPVEVSTPPAQEEPPIVKRTVPVEDKSDESPPPPQNQENEDDETQPASEPEQIPAPAPKKKEEEQTKRSGEKAREGGGGERKRKRRQGRSGGVGPGEGYKRYVFKVMKQVHQDLAISSQAMTVINNLMGDMFERIAAEAATLSKYVSRTTLSSREIQDAVKLVLPGYLGKHAIAEGTKAVTTYLGAVNRPSKPN
nr:histone H2B.2-like [Ipomoea batatas]